MRLWLGLSEQNFGLEPTGRPAKSTTSISDKLRRESIRLTQIQDIAGCRLIVSDIAEQEKVVQSLSNLFEHAATADRRQQPSHGYRAVHVIVRCRGKMIEIQVRTALQHLWAELSEKYSDVVDPAIKYGGGDKSTQSTLTQWSSLIARIELLEVNFADTKAQLSSKESLADDEKRQIADVQEELNSFRQQILEDLSDTIEKVEEPKGENDALSD